MTIGWAIVCPFHFTSTPHDTRINNNNNNNDLDCLNEADPYVLTRSSPCDETLIACRILRWMDGGGGGGGGGITMARQETDQRQLKDGSGQVHADFYGAVSGS